MLEQPEHEITLNLLAAVAAELEPEESSELLADRELIETLLALGPEPSPEQVAQWIQDADHR